MVYYVYSLYDRLVGAYGQPQFSLNDEKTTIEQYRRMIIAQKDVDKIDQIKDLQLCFLGTFKDDSGEFIQVGTPEILCNLGQFVPIVKEVKQDAPAQKEV